MAIGDRDREGSGRAPDLRVVVCGEVMVTARGGTPHIVRGRQPQAVLGYLALEDRTVLRDELAEALWGERFSSHWQGALRGVLSKVRASLAAVGLPPSTLRSEDASVWLDVPGGVRTDLGDAERDVVDGERALASGAYEDAIAAARAAGHVLARPFLPHNDSEWSRTKREAIAVLAARAAHLGVSALLAAGQPGAAASAARARVAVEPLDEAMHHLLVSALLADGRRAAAIEVFSQLADVLSVELGIAPAAETAALLDVVEAAPRRATRSSAPFQLIDGTPFVGRGTESAAIDHAWEQVVGERCPRVVVLEGPAGIGKTRLATQACSAIAERGGTVLWGRSRADDGRAYGAIAEAIGAALDVRPGMLERLGARAAGIVRLLPHLADRIDEHHPPDDDGMARTHLFAATSEIVRELAAAPAVLVLDDLHWAGTDTMALLDHVLDGLDRPLLVLCTTRPSQSASTVGLGAIQRIAPVTTIRLEALTIPELAELVAGHGPPFDPDDLELAAALHARTAGLPFFAAELARDAQQTGVEIDPGTVPVAVRDWLGRRLATLPRDMADLLDLAAVIGTEVEVRLLQRTAAGDADQHAALVDALVQQGLLAGDAEPGVVAFSHAITRDIVYDALGPARRALLHRRVADALAAGPPRPDRGAELAHHYRQAGPDLRGAAAAHAHDAGNEALSQGAWERASAHFEASLSSSDSPVATARALIGLGQARLRQARFDHARSLLQEAVELAAAEGLPFELADATLTLVGRAGRGVSPDRARQAAQLRRALDALRRVDPSAPSADRGQRRSVLLSQLERELAVSMLLTDAAEERNRLLDSAFARARALPRPDPPTLAAAILALRMRALPAYGPEQRLADIDEVLSVPPGRLRPDLLLLAHCYQHEDRLLIGDRAGADASLAAVAELVDRYPDPYWYWALGTWRCLCAILDGALDDAERLAFEASALLPGVDEAVACLGVNLINVRLYQRRAGEVVDLLAAAVESNPEIPCYRAVLALCASESGNVALATTSYEWFASAAFENLPEDTNRYLGLAVLAHVAADLGDVDGAAPLYDLLLPHRGQLVLLNCYGGGGAAWGPASHALARLAVTLGRADDAKALFAEARAEASGSPLALERIEAHAARAPAS